VRDNRLASYRRNRKESLATITGIVVNGNRSGTLPILEIGDNLEIEVELEVEKKLQGAVLNLILKTSHGERAVLLFSGDQGFNLFVGPGRCTVSVRVDALPLAPGTYFADIGINQSVESLAYDAILDFPMFDVVNTGQVAHWLDRPWGVLHLESIEWKME
jgi:lipopolysaccharide transport system ATP-binding protein